MKNWKAGILFLLLTLVLCVPVSAEAATSEQRENCKQKLMEMLYSAETDAQNISQYRMTTAELDELCAEIRYGEGAEIFGGYFPSAKFSYTYSLLGGYVRTIRLTNVNGDALTRYEQMVPVIDSIIAGIEDDMTDLDKLLYLHDVVVETVAYKKTTDAMYIASGALVDKQAVCAGYAKALNVLLHRVGLETSYVSGTSLDHGWSYVKLDGQWYHVDPTWDDTRTPVSGKTSRENLLRNDAEFGRDHGVWEVRVVDEASESTIYENWVVHDIVGEMRFEDGLWYYLDTDNKEVVAIDAVNNCKEELFSYSCLGSVTLVDVIGKQMILSVNGREESRTVEEWKIVAEEAENMTGGEAIFPMDFSDITYWRTGHYNSSTGTYGANKNRVCLNDVIENMQEQYTITISDENYRIAIRELNGRKKLIASVELGDGDVYIPSEGTCYLGVLIFNGVQEKGITFANYEEMFAKGFTVGLNLRAEEEGLPEPEEPETNVPEDSDEAVPEVPETEDMDETVLGDTTTEEPEEGVTEELKSTDSLFFSDITYWRTGHYNPYTGTYGANKNRICLNDVLENTQEQYTITISEENYKIAIRELNERKKLIASVELSDGDDYIPSEGTCYLGVSIFNGVQEKGITFANYEEMFANGFTVGLNLYEEENESEAFVEKTEPEYEDIESSEKTEPEKDEFPELEETETNAPDNLEEGDTEGLQPAYSLDLTDISNWRTGHFNPNTGTYGLNSNRICLYDYMENLHEKYLVTISDPDYRIIVREYNERKRLVLTGDVGNGELYIPAEDTCYLSFSIYNSVQEKGIRFTHYETLFAEGFTVGIYTVK